MGNELDNNKVIAMSDDQLEAVSGGGRVSGKIPKKCCPKCSSFDILPSQGAMKNKCLCNTCKFIGFPDEFPTIL